jgi:enoyl-CoA hydratase/3-hydroxyacyl-CoA dehydrogenase
VPGVTDVQLKPRQIRKVAVIGGGLMGSGIATALLVGNISVVLKEINTQFLQRGQKTIAGHILLNNCCVSCEFISNRYLDFVSPLMYY